MRKAQGLEEPKPSWSLDILEVDVQCGVNQWLCFLLAERYCLNVTELEVRSERVCPRCLGVARLEDATGGVAGVDILGAAILVEVSFEADDNVGNWDAIVRKQSKGKLAANKPTREMWLEILNRFCSSGMLRRVEVQDLQQPQEEAAVVEPASPPVKRPRSWLKKPSASVPGAVDSPGGQQRRKSSSKCERISLSNA